MSIKESGSRTLAALGRLLTRTNRGISRGLSRLRHRRYMRRAALWLKALRSFSIDLGVVSLIIVAIFLILSEARREVIVIQPIEVPKHLSEAGYTPNVAARVVMGYVREIQEIAKTTMRRRSLEFSDTMSNVILPETGFSIRTITDYLQSMLGDRSTQVWGEVTEENGDLQFHLQINGKRIDIPESRGASLEPLLNQAAQAVLRETEPFILASYLFEKDIGAALKEADRIMINAPQNGETMARTCNLRGLILDSQNQADRAIEMYKKALSVDPKASYAYFNLCGALIAKGQIGEAIEICGKTVTLVPKDPQSYLGLGIALQMNGQNVDAYKNFQKVLKLEPNNAVAASHLKQLQDKMKSSLKK